MMRLRVQMTDEAVHAPFDVFWILPGVVDFFVSREKCIVPLPVWPIETERILKN